MVAVETNILVYAHRREVAEHEAAKQVLKELSEGSVPWAIPWPCFYEFFSVVTNPRIWKHTAPSSGDQACQQLAAWYASPTLRRLSEGEDFWPVLERLISRPRVRGPIVRDARIAALCVAHGVEELLTRDRDFSLFPELCVRNPFN